MRAVRGPIEAEFCNAPLQDAGVLTCPEVRRAVDPARE